MVREHVENSERVENPEKQEADRLEREKTILAKREKREELNHGERVEYELMQIRKQPSSATVSFGDLHNILELLVKGK